MKFRILFHFAFSICTGLAKFWSVAVSRIARAAVDAKFLDEVDVPVEVVSHPHVQIV